MRRLIAGCRRSWRLAVAPLSAHQAGEPEAVCGAATVGFIFYERKGHSLIPLVSTPCSKPCFVPGD